MDKVKDFLNSFPRGTRADWCRLNNLDPTRISQIANGHKGVGLDYAAAIISGSGGKLTIYDFVESPDMGAQKATA